MVVKGKLRFICIVLLILLMAGCATFERQAFNKTAHQDLKRIGLIEPACNKEYYVQNLGHAGISFGLIGGLIAVADMQSKANEFTELMKSRNFKVDNEFQGLLATELQNAGYSVKVIKTKREKADFLNDYSSLDKDVDAYLDIGINAGYICASWMSDYVPAVRSSIRLVKRETKDILYQDSISYGYEFYQSKAVQIAAEQRYFFKDFRAITENPELAMEGLQKGIPLVAKRIAEDLIRQ